MKNGIYNLLKNLNTNKAAGPDEIPLKSNKQQCQSNMQHQHLQDYFSNHKIQKSYHKIEEMQTLFLSTKKEIPTWLETTFQSH